LGVASHPTPNSQLPIAHALTIAGSDSGGGAGIQADLKTFAALGVYGSSVITAITAQNTVGVFAVQEIDTDVIAKQIDAVIDDIGAAGIKTGMLSSAAIIETVAGRLRHHGLQNLVVDPVMVAKSGDSLLRPEAVSVLRELLLPLATIVTPNLPEAETLTGRRVETQNDMRDAARAIADMGPRAVVVKGGHLAGAADDVLFDGSGFHVLHAERVDTPHTHGTGCTFSAAITAGLARGRSVPDAVADAKAYLTRAIEQAYAIGRGHSPVHHFHALW
jgi:hydroxymethylpyrimidine/phosphomethylpyrimidine kinase